MDLTVAERLARETISLLLGDEWSFRFDHAKARLGSCNATDKVITLSRPLTELNNETLVFDTLLHEIAHAKAGIHAGHGLTWKLWAERLGASPSPCLPAQVRLPLERWLGYCPSCGVSIRRHRRSQLACASCCRRFNRGRWSARFLFHWESSDATGIPAEMKDAEPFTRPLDTSLQRD